VTLQLDMIFCYDTTQSGGWYNFAEEQIADIFSAGDGVKSTH